MQYQIFSSIDATYTSCLGKYVNDSTFPNAKMMVQIIDKKPHLLLFALDEIQAGTEIRFNYGAPGLWWRKRFPALNKPVNIKV